MPRKGEKALSKGSLAKNCQWKKSMPPGEDEANSNATSNATCALCCKSMVEDRDKVQSLYNYVYLTKDVAKANILTAAEHILTVYTVGVSCGLTE